MSKILISAIGLILMSGAAVAEGRLVNDPSLPLPPNTYFSSPWMGFGATSLPAGWVVPESATTYAKYNGRTYVIDPQGRTVLRTVR